ncbi:hypothetical protein TrCOL_g5355 [Triparma columacea]|uniref:Uncharacterized protein n=1 Tax=Triparma columacea TaxID=722753 RepID=A0A9W7GNT3_9STRA|nr:hypothetical protein TrCOL_g5355 [Triparma columacea]
MYSSSQADNLRSALLDDPIISNLTLDIDTSETSLLRGKKPLRSLDIEDGADENTDVNDDDTLEMLDALKATYASKYSTSAPHYTSLGGRADTSSPTNPFRLSTGSFDVGERFNRLLTFTGMATTIGATALVVIIFWAVFEACRRF